MMTSEAFPCLYRICVTHDDYSRFGILCSLVDPNVSLPLDCCCIGFVVYLLYQPFPNRNGIVHALSLIHILKFPHHEDEIAQSCGSAGCSPANVWMHANMLNVNGQKMSKSLGNYFLPKEIVDGTTEVFDKPYSPQVIRFCMMQAHYRSCLLYTS